MDDSLCLLPLVDLATMLASGELSSRELLSAYLARVERINPTVNAICTLAGERATGEAAAADARRSSGELLGALHGVPMTIKDAIATAGIRSTGGTPIHAELVPTQDAPAVAALRAAGAIVFGKTNVPLWSGDIQTFNELFGTTNNPWDPTRTPGGSSGGAAAAVSCAMTAAELGTDIGGSVRVPAAFCGVFGHKPSYGVVPQQGYLDSDYGPSITDADVNVFGPIARSAADLGALLDVVAAPGRRAELAPSPPGDPIAGLRVAAWLDDPALPVDPELLGLHHRAADALEAAGAIVDRAARPSLDLASSWRLGSLLIGVATSVSFGDAELAAQRARAESPDATDDERAAIARWSWPHRDWLSADRARAEMRLRWAEFFEDWDVLLCPISGRTAIPHQPDGGFADRMLEIAGGQRPYLELIGWTSLIGAAYLPSTSAPIGRTDAGLPAGIQVVSPYLHDRRSIAVAGRLCELVEGYAVPPIAR